MPSYNHEDYVGEAIESVLSQTFADWELIVVDDHSTDGSWRVIDEFSDQRITKVRLPVNGGGAGAYNEALRRSSGQVIMSLDSDDAFLPDKMRVQVAAFEDQPGVGIVGSFIETGHGRVVPSDEEAAAVTSWFNVDLDLNRPDSWIWQNRLAHSATAVRRTAHDLIGPERGEMDHIPDWDLWLRGVSLEVRFAVITEPLTMYRFQPGSVTHSDPVATVIEYLGLSADYWHPYLRRTGRSDLVVANLSQALNRYAAMDAPGRARATNVLSGLLRSEPEAADTMLAYVASTRQLRDYMAEVLEAKTWLEAQWMAEKERADGLAARPGAAPQRPARRRQ
jgi:glycosyltransferase involved in cell wall biosynthesis